MRKCVEVCKTKGIGIWALTLEQRKANGKKGAFGGSKGGKIGGAKSGAKNLAKIPANRRLEIARAGGQAAGHVTNHVNRLIISPFCELCQQALAAESAKQIAEEEYEVDDFAEEYDNQIRHRDIAVDGCQCKGCISIRLAAHRHPVHKASRGLNSTL